MTPHASIAGKEASSPALRLILGAARIPPALQKVLMAACLMLIKHYNAAKPA